ncbi:MAG: pseudouridine synthase, partial [Bacillota bacterium]
MIDVVYEDNHVIVVIKPVNVPSQADDSGDLDMLSMVKSYIKIKYEKPGEVYIGLIHRLDRPAGGLMVFARTSKAASRLSEQMRLRKIEKRYFAVCGDTESPGVAGGPEVAGSPGVGVRLEAYIAKD